MSLTWSVCPEVEVQSEVRAAKARVEVGAKSVSKAANARVPNLQNVNNSGQYPLRTYRRSVRRAKEEEKQEEMEEERRDANGEGGLPFPVFKRWLGGGGCGRLTSTALTVHDRPGGGTE